MCERGVDIRLSSIFVGLLLVAAVFASYNVASLFLYSSASSKQSDGDLVIPESETASSMQSDSFLLNPHSSTIFKKASRKFHVALTATSSPYIQWQTRVAYYSYKKVKHMPGSDMGGFTRILHSGEADGLMHEIPTFVVNNLPQGRDKGYAPLNRPWAFLQWLELASIEEDYVMMLEPDHIFVKAMPNLAVGDIPAGYSFFYIVPLHKSSILRKFYPLESGPLTDIDPVGNSPVIIKKRLLKKLASTWVSLSLKMIDDPETQKDLGWVLEMYAYALSAAWHGIRHILVKDLMVQPPLDTEIGSAYMIHFTYAMDYTLKGERLEPGKRGEWRFDKRSYLQRPPPKNLTMPPQGVPETVVAVLKMINEASASTAGWELL